MTESSIRQMIEAAASQVVAASQELTRLDRQIGDGDHGSNMKLASETVLAQVDQIAAKPLPEALKSIGNILMLKVGGASGPLYGTLFITLGKGLAEDPGAIAASFEAAVSAVKRLGKSDIGCKTMLDVLVPVQRMLSAGGADLPARLKGIAADGAASTVSMRATRGRASFLGERSDGHMDPGARSSQIILSAICDAVA